MNSLASVLNFLGKIPYINDGGCGIAALSCHRWLEKNKPELLEKFSVIYMYYEEEKRTFGRNYAKFINKDFKDIFTPPHVAIKYGDFLLDIHGEAPTWEFKIWHEVSLEFLVENLKYGAWNYRFSRFASIPVIEKALDIDLQDVIEFQQRNESIGFSEIIGEIE